MVDYSQHFSEDVPSFFRSPVREIFKRVDLSKIYSFAGGYPSADTFPLSQMDTTYHPPLPLGIADAEVQNRCKVYPNPAKKLFIMENTENELVGIVVHDAFGQIVDKKSLLPGQQLYYNTEKLRCGVYILFFATKSKCYTQKLIISR